MELVRVNGIFRKARNLPGGVFLKEKKIDFDVCISIDKTLKPGFAKYAVDTKLFLIESSILTPAKRAANRNNVSTDNRAGGEGEFSGGEYT